MQASEVRQCTSSTWVDGYNALDMLLSNPTYADAAFLVCQCLGYMQCEWYQSKKDMNRRAHCEHGNGPKGNQKGKGKGSGKQQIQNASSSGTVEERNQEFLRQMKEAIPAQAKIRMQATLIESEWNVPVVPYQHLGASGGVAVVPRDELPSIVARVGFTGKATAVVVVQHPDELGLRAYPRSQVSFTLSVAGADGAREYISAKRWLVQLGFGDQVSRVVEGEQIYVEQKMKKMTARFSRKRGWDDGEIPASIMMNHLEQLIPDLAVDQLQSRMNGSFAFYCHEDFIDDVLCASGKNGIFIKCQSDDVAPLELLWLPETMSLTDAINMTKDKRVIGLAEKGMSGRLALRFKTNDALANFAKEYKYVDTSHLARWKVSGYPLNGGLHGLSLLLGSRKWKDVSVVYMDSKEAVFHSSNRGNDLPLYYMEAGQGQQVKFKALNAVARGMQRQDREAGTSSGTSIFPERRAPREERQKVFLQRLNDKSPNPKASQVRQRSGDHTGETPPPKERKEG